MTSPLDLGMQGPPPTLPQTPPASTFRLPPDSAGTIRAFSRMGYHIGQALADIVDNSIDARATAVDICFLRDNKRISAVMIADDGVGMTAAMLEHAMQFGARIDHKEDDLGTFGLGLKSASFSQCQSLTVVTRRQNQTAACRWTVQAIQRDWTCERLDLATASSIFRSGYTTTPPASGTVVLWDQLDRLGY